MATGTTVYVFQTGVAKKAFGLSYDKTGNNLPKDREWRSWKSFDTAQTKGRIGFDEEAQKALEEHGFWAPVKFDEPEVVAPVKAKKKVKVKVAGKR